MSAHSSAPAFGRAQVATPALFTAQQGSSIPAGSRPARLTKRAIAVAAATLCAPAVAAVALAAVGAAGGGSPAELGTLEGAQGLRGTTVAAPAALRTFSGSVSASGRADGERPATTAREGLSAPAPAEQVRSRPSPSTGTRAPAHKPPIQTPKPPPAPKLSPPPRAPVPTYDPSGPGAPTTSGTTSNTSTGGSSSPAGNGPGSPDRQTGVSGGD